jgi:hypothetical protein
VKLRYCKSKAKTFGLFEDGLNLINMEIYFKEEARNKPIAGVNKSQML